MGLSPVVFFWVLPLPHPGNLVLIALPKPPADSTGTLGLLQALSSPQGPRCGGGRRRGGWRSGRADRLGEGGKKMGGRESSLAQGTQALSQVGGISVWILELFTPAPTVEDRDL